MAQKRYEMSNKQSRQIKDLFPIAKTGCPPIDNRLMFNAFYGLPEAAPPSVTCQSVFAHEKRYTAAFVNGVMMDTIHY